MLRLLVATFLGFFCTEVSACLINFPEAHSRCSNWFALLYYGKMTNDNLGRVIAFNYSLNRETLYSLELGKELSPCHPVRIFFQPLVSSVDFRANITLLKDYFDHDIFELTPYFTLNWYQFPWNHYLQTLFSIGEGISYASKVPNSEAQHSDQPKRLLNYLLCEAGFSLPHLPHWEMLIRIHHRSGAYGLYRANNSGSTAIGLAIRYYFH